MDYKLKTASSGIAGLDEVLCGGFPQGKIFLVEGNPGAGKTTLALQFLLAGRDAGEACLYITLSESINELKAVARTHGWDLKGIDLYELPMEEQLTADAQNTFFHTSEIELGVTNQRMLDEIKRVKPRRVVIDSMTELKLMAQNPMRFRRQILAYKQFFLSLEITVLLLDDKTSSISDQEVQSIVHGIVKVEQLAPEYGSERRRISISKMRGTAYRGGFHDFSIKTGGITVFPRLIAAEHGIGSVTGEISSGVEGIDKLIGGGVERGSSTLVMGPSGSGKSTIALKYAHHAASEGERVHAFIFDEGLHTLFNRSAGMNMDIRPFIAKGLVTVTQVDPAQLSPGEFFSLVRNAVEKEKATVIVIDSLNGYMNAMPAERYLIIQMHELLSYLSQMGVATFVVVVQHGLLGTTMETSIDVSYLADNVYLLRYFESAGSVRQAISVVKKRSGRHERTIRELKFSTDGISVGEPLHHFQGVLSGTPVILSGVGE